MLCHSVSYRITLDYISIQQYRVRSQPAMRDFAQQTGILGRMHENTHLGNQPYTKTREGQAPVNKRKSWVSLCAHFCSRLEAIATGPLELFRGEVLRACTLGQRSSARECWTSCLRAAPYHISSPPAHRGDRFAQDSRARCSVVRRALVRLEGQAQ